VVHILIWGAWSLVWRVKLTKAPVATELVHHHLILDQA